MKLRILIIEDDAIIALQIKQIIEKLSCICVAIVKNSNSAIETSKLNKIDFIISDINIEGDLDGIDTCKILQDIYKVDILFLTAFNDIETLKKASNINFVGYILKPFRQDELETIINIEKCKIKTNNIYTISDEYYYNMNTQILKYNGNIVKLTKKEILLLDILLQNVNNIVSYNDIESYVWDLEYVDKNTRRQLFYRFISKLKNFPIELEKGIGYKINIKHIN